MIYGELTEADVHEIETEHSHRTLGHRIADERKKERDEAIEQAAYWRNEYLNAAHELREIMRAQHKTERDELVTRLAALTHNMALIAKNASAEEGGKS
ncbi:hypothetical protein [Herbaspirillum seropedicae]|uniref:hypothetical protein n=1 Tax=Herbaspirillum seropedicae TaxID=964 RepID=UPI003FCED313